MTFTLSRRDLLKSVAAIALAARVPFEVVEAALAAGPAPTTLDRTILRAGGTGYRPLVVGPGEPHRDHPSNPVSRSTGRAAGATGAVIASFAQFTDVHVIDSQSPARVEFIDRYACGPGAVVNAAFRPQEAMTTQVLSAMVRAVNAVHLSGRPLQFAVSTGDNVDNQQANELDWFFAGLDGSPSLEPNSGGPGYEGVQSPTWGDPWYWVPQFGVHDRYKDAYGFPDETAWGYAPGGLLRSAVSGYSTADDALAVRWYAAYGNHDGLLQGNMPCNEALRQIAVGPLKVSGPPVGVDPCRSFEPGGPGDAAALFAGPAKLVTPDPRRAPLTRRQYLARHLGHAGHEGFGHGFTPEAAAAGIAYYSFGDASGRFQHIVLDTVNPGGYADGSLGQHQFDWLKAELDRSTGRYVVLFSHHGLHSLSNPVVAPGVEDLEPEQRVMGDEIEALLHQYPNVVAWVAGHTHQNRITLRSGAGHQFWEIETAAHVDWPSQSRLIEIVDDVGVLTIRCTMVDHAGPVTRDEIRQEKDPVLKLAGVNRELSANDPQFDGGVGRGEWYDRNVELTLPDPL